MGELDSGSEALASVYIQTEGLHSDVLHRVSVECVVSMSMVSMVSMVTVFIMVNMITMVIMVRR